MELLPQVMRQAGLGPPIYYKFTPVQNVDSEAQARAETQIGPSLYHYHEYGSLCLVTGDNVGWMFQDGVYFAGSGSMD